MLLEVETDKAVVEIEAAGDGVLSGVTAKVGDVVPVGHTIAWLLKPGESLPTGGLAGADRPQDGFGLCRSRGRSRSRAPEPVSAAGREDLTQRHDGSRASTVSIYRS